MKYEVVKETRLNEGEKEIWYLVEPKSKIMKFIFNNIIPFCIDGYNPYIDKDDAIKEARLKSKGKWEKKISREVI